MFVQCQDLRILNTDSVIEITLAMDSDSAPFKVLASLNDGCDEYLIGRYATLVDAQNTINGIAKGLSAIKA